MRLIVPIEFYRQGGVERVILSLITELAAEADHIILVLPPGKVAYFQSLLPRDRGIIYESFSWPPASLPSRLLKLLHKAVAVANKLRFAGAKQWLEQTIYQLHYLSRIHHLSQKHRATHCLYTLTHRLQPPKLNIPLAMIEHDVFWRFAPLTYPDHYVRQYDQSMLEWLQASDLAFAVSQKTQQDMLTVFPQFKDKLHTIPWAGFIPEAPVAADPPPFAGPIFYFPSSFGIYKDHLTLLRAGIQLAKEGYQFKVVLVGRETDQLINGGLQLSQQSQTQEYRNYLAQCQQLYQDEQPILASHFLGLGYCDHDDVEAWYQRCSCVVMPSQYEGFGLAVSEAIVRGLPVICSDLEVFDEQVELYQCPDQVDQFPRGDAQALADCMRQFLLHPKPRLTPESTSQRFSHWTWETVASQYAQRLQQCTPALNR